MGTFAQNDEDLLVTKKPMLIVDYNAAFDLHSGVSFRPVGQPRNALRRTLIVAGTEAEASNN